MRGRQEWTGLVESDKPHGKWRIENGGSCHLLKTPRYKRGVSIFFIIHEALCMCYEPVGVPNPTPERTVFTSANATKITRIPTTEYMIIFLPFSTFESSPAAVM